MTYQKYRMKKYIAWRKRVNSHLPDLMGRVFALRDKHYSGCGFHYSLESLAGKVLHLVNTQDIERDVAGQLIDEILVEDLFRRVAQAEKGRQ